LLSRMAVTCAVTTNSTQLLASIRHDGPATIRFHPVQPRAA
jgi:hypothetical protein